MGTLATPDFQVIAAVNDDAILANNLERSPLIASGAAGLKCYRGAPSASQAYNQGLDESESPIVIFAHQDVFLPEGWGEALAAAIADIEQHDPDWAVIGACGVDDNGQYLGHVWSSGLSRRLGGRFGAPVKTTSIDELVIVLRRASGIRFDEGLPGFHLYGTDIVLIAREAGFRSYIANIPAIHNSRPVRTYRGSYADGWRYMRAKWRDSLPIQTLTVPLTRSYWPLLLSQFRLWRSLNRRLARATDSRIDPRQLLHHLDL